MPRLTMEQMARVVPRWPENSDGVEAPEGICGDWRCACADEARRVLTDGEYELAFGLPKEYGTWAMTAGCPLSSDDNPS